MKEIPIESGKSLIKICWYNIHINGLKNLICKMVRTHFKSVSKKREVNFGRIIESEFMSENHFRMI